jgi:hypothetical protein
MSYRESLGVRVTPRRACYAGSRQRSSPAASASPGVATANTRNATPRSKAHAPQPQKMLSAPSPAPRCALDEPA